MILECENNDLTPVNLFAAKPYILLPESLPGKAVKLRKTFLRSVFGNAVFWVLTKVLTKVLTSSKYYVHEPHKQIVIASAGMLDFCVGRVDIRTPYRT